MMHLKGIFESLQNHQVKYLLCGGFAVNIYGVPRTTADLDLLIEFSEENIINFETAIKEHGYKKNLFFELKTLINSALREKYYKEKNLVVYSYNSDVLRSVTLDVLVHLPVTFEECWERKSEKIFSGIQVHVISLEDLILLKQYANRDQDQSDIINLKKFLKK